MAALILLAVCMVTRPIRTHTFNGLVRRQEVKFFRKKKLFAHQVSKESKFGHFFVVVSDFEILVFYLPIMSYDTLTVSHSY